MQIDGEHFILKYCVSIHFLGQWTIMGPLGVGVKAFLDE